MPAVSQIQMQAVSSRLNSGMNQSSPMPDSASTPAGIGGFLSVLDRSANARLSANSGTQGGSLSLKSMQNLPIRGAKTSEAANNADPMQLLMGQLVAQSMMTQAFAGQNQATVASQDQASVASQDQGTLNSLNVATPAGVQQLINSVGAQSLDIKQTALIAQALSRALKASGGDGVGSQTGQAAQLLQAFQNQLQTQQATGLALNQATDQAKQQTNAQIALSAAGNSGAYLAQRQFASLCGCRRDHRGPNRCPMAG